MGARKPIQQAQQKNEIPVIIYPSQRLDGAKLVYERSFSQRSKKTNLLSFYLLTFIW